jgi:hypothetical protein
MSPTNESPTPSLLRTGSLASLKRSLSKKSITFEFDDLQKIIRQERIQRYQKTTSILCALEHGFRFAIAALESDAVKNMALQWDLAAEQLLGAKAEDLALPGANLVTRRLVHGGEAKDTLRLPLQSKEATAPSSSSSLLDSRTSWHGETPSPCGAGASTVAVELMPTFTTLKARNAPPVEQPPPRNPITADTFPLVMCQADLTCTLYDNPVHCSLRKHTCREGNLCRDDSVIHQYRFAHALAWEHSDDDDFEIVIEDPSGTHSD